MNKIPLSPIDQIFVGQDAYPIEFVFHYPKGLCPSELLAALKRTLTDFPPLASYVEWDETANGWHFSASGKAPYFAVRPNLDAPLDSVVTMPGEPLLKVVVSQGEERDLLGVSMSHAVADGFSFFFFLTSWFANYNGISHPGPTHNRGDFKSFLACADAPDKILPESFFDRTGISWVPDTKRSDLTDVSYIRTLYEPADRVDGASDNANLAATSLRSWVATYARGDQVRLSCAVDLRKRVPVISSTYFGNAIYGAAKRWTREGYDLLSDAHVARQIHNEVAGTDFSRVQKIVSSLQALFAQEGASVSRFLHVAAPDCGLLVTNLSRLPMNLLDCGTGVPLDVTIMTKAPNVLVVTAHNGKLVKNICLPRRVA